MGGRYAAAVVKYRSKRPAQTYKKRCLSEVCRPKIHFPDSTFELYFNYTLLPPGKT